MIIDNTYFRGEIYIPHAKPSASDGIISVKDDIISFIDEYEKDCLIKCLGYGLSREFMQQLDSTKLNGLKDDVDAKWNDLLNGKDYENSEGESVSWEGIRRKAPITAEKHNSSFLAHYVYWFYEKSDHITRSGSGNQINKSKNADTIVPQDKVIKSWRKFVKIVQGEERKPVIIEKSYGFGVDWYQGGEDITLYKFIQDMNSLVPDTYAKFNPKLWVNVNQFGI